MTSVEAAPAPKSSESPDASGSPETPRELKMELKPHIERKQPAYKPLEFRKDALEKLTTETIPQHMFDKVDDFFQARLQPLLDGKMPKNPDALDRYLATDDTPNRLDALIFDLKKKPMTEVLKQLRAAPDDKAYSMDEVRGLGVIFDRAARPEKEAWENLPGDSTEREMRKRQIRVGEMLFLEARMDELRDIERTKQKGSGFVDRTLRVFEQYQRSLDTPAFFKRRLAQEESNAKLSFLYEEAPQSAETPPAAADTEPVSPPDSTETPPADVESPAPETPPVTPDAGPTDTAEEPAPTPKPKQRKAPEPEPEAPATPEAAPTTPTPERVFDREVMTPEQVRSVSREIRGLLESGNPDDAFRAAWELAQLKRAGLTLQNEKAMRFTSSQLQRHLDHWRQQAPGKLGGYLSYLKYLGVVDAVSEADKQSLSLAAIQAAEQNWTDDLSQLAVWNKYLGVTDGLPKPIQEKLQADVRAKIAAGEKPRAALRLARLQYLGVESGLSGEETESVYTKTDSQANRAANAGRWDVFSRLHTVLDRLRGTSPMPQDAQAGIVTSLQRQATVSSERERWGAFTSFYADAVALSRLNDAAPEIENPGTVETFLGGLERDPSGVQAANEYRAEAAQAREESDNVLDDELPGTGAAETATGEAAAETQIATVIPPRPQTFWRGLLHDIRHRW